jgi:hypothetical protein
VTTKQRRAIIAAAVAWLRAGTLPDALPARLMDEYGLTPGQARELAAAALWEWKAKREAK